MKIFLVQLFADIAQIPIIIKNINTYSNLEYDNTY